MLKSLGTLGLLGLVHISASAFSPSCMLGAKCIKSQGTSIPSKQVIEMMERCDEFTSNGYGRQVLRMSIQEIIQRSGGNPSHPLYSAYYAFNMLHESPLAFDRKSSVEDTNYDQIARSCRQLNIDFERWAK